MLETRQLLKIVVKLISTGEASAGLVTTYYYSDGTKKEATNVPVMVGDKVTVFDSDVARENFPHRQVT